MSLHTLVKFPLKWIWIHRNGGPLLSGRWHFGQCQVPRNWLEWFLKSRKTTLWLLEALLSFVGERKWHGRVLRRHSIPLARPMRCCYWMVSHCSPGIHSYCGWYCDAISLSRSRLLREMASRSQSRPLIPSDTLWTLFRNRSLEQINNSRSFKICVVFIKKDWSRLGCLVIFAIASTKCNVLYGCRYINQNKTMHRIDLNTLVLKRAFVWVCCFTVQD